MGRSGWSVLVAGLALVGCAGSGGRLNAWDEQAIAGRTYVLIGASSGFGRGVAEALGSRGARLVLAARRSSLLDEVAERVWAAGGTAMVVPTDVSDPAALQRLAEVAFTKLGHVDAWINFAGVGAIGRFWDIPVADQARLIDVNLKGMIYSNAAALRVFRAQGYGTVVNLGSVESELPLAYHAAYAASKAGVRSLDQAINQELRLAGLDRIKVVTVEPWAVDTPFWRHAANYSGGTPRFAPIDGPEEVVEAVVWVSLHPQDELPVGGKAQAVWFGHHLAPHLVERISADLMHRYQIETAPPAPRSDGSLFTPMQSGSGVEDGVRARIQAEDAAAGR